MITPVSAADRSIHARRSPFFLVLEHAGRRVLRPGGFAASRQLLSLLAINHRDDVVELAAGVGATARRILASRPASYIAVEPEIRFAEDLDRVLRGSRVSRLERRAESTGLPDASADVVLGEAVLTMQPIGRRRAIVAEAARVLRPRGRYGIHELAVLDAETASAKDLRDELSQQTHVNALPMSPEEWSELLSSAGLQVVSIGLFPVRLLSVRGVVADEGLLGALRVAARLAVWPAGWKRVRRTKRSLKRHDGSLQAVVLVATKPGERVEAA